jgi:hypothetical protein
MTNFVAPEKVLKHFRAGMNTQEMAVVFNMPEYTVYWLLNNARELERENPDNFALAAKRKQVVEVGEGRESLPLPEIH